MSKHFPRGRKDACRLCEFSMAPRPLTRPSRRIPQVLSTSRTFTTSSRNRVKNSQIAFTSQSDPATRPKSKGPVSSTPESGLRKLSITEEELAIELQHTRRSCNALLALPRIPTERESLLVLTLCAELAQRIAGEPAKPDERKDGTAAHALLSLEDSKNKKVRLQKLSREAQQMVDEISQLANTVIKHPPVFITRDVLSAYVATQSSLGKADSFGEAFYMYANKPVPVEGSSPITYTKQNPDSVRNDIPIDLADRALQTAIEAKQLVAAMDIIENGHATKAFRRAKFVRRGLLPITGLALGPVAAYSVATQLALYQDTMETGLATNLAFAGILAYFCFTTSIGVVAITTANDQMERVTWAKGTPLRERWSREEERAAIDRIACSWGFSETWRRGEEEGEDWFLLREWIGNKGMILDAVELMEGME